MRITKNRGTPKWMVKIMENPMNKTLIKPLFLVGVVVRVAPMIPMICFGNSIFPKIPDILANHVVEWCTYHIQHHFLYISTSWTLKNMFQGSTQILVVCIFKIYNYSALVPAWSMSHAGCNGGIGPLYVLFWQITKRCPWSVQRALHEQQFDKDNTIAIEWLFP